MDRAKTVKAALIDYGIKEDKIAVYGIGGANPLVPFSDSENRWKNRRVEFILVK